MVITIADVARAAGVSQATVSRCLNHPELVSPDKRQRIEEVISRLNYVPNNMAKALTTSHTNTIGVIVPDINNVYFPHRAGNRGLSVRSRLCFFPVQYRPEY